jgi:hypothetical protein
MRGFSRIVIAAAAVAAIAGCSDSVTSPSDATNRPLAPGDRPSLDYSASSRFSGFKTTTFTLTSNGGTFAIGDLYTLTVPAGAVCSLSSSYGPGSWDKPCTTLASGQSVKITATYGFSKNGPVVDFSPDIRFSPSKQVTLSTDLYAPLLTAFRGYWESNQWALRYFGIYYTSDLGVTGKTDAASDPSLLTHINLKTGRVWRRIKHFSGYSVATGLPCEPKPEDPDCAPLPGPVIERG